MTLNGREFVNEILTEYYGEFSGAFGRGKIVTTMDIITTKELSPQSKVRKWLSFNDQTPHESLSVDSVCEV